MDVQTSLQLRLEALEHEQAAARLLGHFCDRVGGAFDPGAGLRAGAEALAQHVGGVCAIYTLAEGALVPAASATADDALSDVAVALARSELADWRLLAAPLRCCPALPGAPAIDLAVAPIRSRGQLLGVLALAIDPARSRPLPDDALLGRLAERAGLTLDIRQSQQAAARRLVEIATVRQVARVINSNYQPATMFETIVQQISAAFGYHLVSVYLREGDGLALQACVGYTDVIAFIRLDQAVAGRVARTGQAAFVRDASADPDFIVVVPGTQQAIIVPINGPEAEVLGTLLIESLTQTLTENDLALLTLIADQIGVAVTNARLIEALRLSEGEFRALIADLHVGVMVQGPLAEILICNQSACDLLGLTEAQLRGLTSFDPSWSVIHEDGTPFPGETHPVPRAIATGRPVRNVVMGVNRPMRGDQIWLLVNAEPQFALDGMLTHVICTFNEITERKQAEEALRASEERFRVLVEQAPVPISVVVDGVIRIVNRAYLDLVRASDSSQVVGSSSVSCIAPAVRPEILRRGERRTGGLPEAMTYETTGIRLDGSEFPMYVQLATVRIPEGNAIIAFLTDLSAQKAEEESRLALERRLLEAQKLESLGTLAGGIAHDFNNLLTAILGNVELMRLDLPAHPVLHDGLDAIATAARRATDLAGQMLAYSGRGRFVLEPLDIATLIDEMESLFHAAIPRTITVSVAAADAKVRGDARQLRQLLLNLIVNAAEAIGDEPGTIAITTRRQELSAADLAEAFPGAGIAPGAYVLLEVADTGHGMDTATLNRIFEPFFSTKFIGRGLGLPAALGIVRGHRGAIRARSVAGLGTTVTVLLPVAELPERATEKPPAPDWRAGRPGAVLVVDDEEAVRLVAVRALERMRLPVLTAADGREGLSVFAANRESISAVLLDLTMPQLGGVETYEAIRRMAPDVPVVLMSGYSAQDAAAAFDSAALAGFLQKPFAIADVQAALRPLISTDGGPTR